MKQRTMVGVGLVAAGAALWIGGRFGRARRRAGATFGSLGIAGQRLELEAAPLLVIRGAHDEVNVVAGDGPHVVVHAMNRDLTRVVHVRRGDDDANDDEVGDDEIVRSRALLLMVHPRSRIDVTVPRGTAVRLEVAKSRSALSGIDDVDVRSAKCSLTLRDVAGTVRIISAKDDIEVELSSERKTRAVDVTVAKGRFALTVPAARGGVYRVNAAKTTLSAPPSVEGGVPVRVRAARSAVLIRAA
jgi:hypothetical protein